MTGADRLYAAAIRPSVRIWGWVLVPDADRLGHDAPGRARPPAPGAMPVTGWAPEKCSQARALFLLQLVETAEDAVLDPHVGQHAGREQSHG